MKFAGALAATALIAAIACKSDSVTGNLSAVPWDRISGQIAFTGDSGVYEIDGATRTVTRIYGDGHGAGFPGAMWSAQGDRLMLVHMPSRFTAGQPASLGSSLIEISAAGTVLRELGSGSDTLCCASYSRDRRATYLNHYRDVWVDGAMAFTNGLTNSRPVWTPDSRFVLVSSGGIAGTDQLYRVDPATGERVLAFPQSPGRYVDPVFSPDGTHMAFVRGEPDVFGLFQLWIINADGTAARQLTHGHTDTSPSWSPDGTQLVFVRANIADGVARFAIVRADGTDVAEFPIPRDASVTPHVSWRP